MKHSNYLLCSVTLFLIFFTSCEKEEPVASFTISKITAEVDEIISFINTSTFASSYTWDFGDGNSSSNENPEHSYSSDGTFTVKLTATGDGGENSTTKTIVVEIGSNIFPGESAMNISLEESWATVQNKLDSDYTQYGPLMISGGSGSVIIHPVESKSEGILLYFISLTGSMTLNSSDMVFLISLDENFEGQTEKGIKMGSSLSDVESAYGTPDEHDAGYSKYEYDIGIDFYYDSSSKVDGINISTPTSSSKSTDISKELIMNHLKR